MIPRSLKEKILLYLNEFPVVAILGPRQCGKSTLTINIINNNKKNDIY